MRARLNLASRPFRNERLANAGLLLLAATLLAATGWHAQVVAELVGGGSGARDAAQAQQTELADLRAEAAALAGPAPAAADVARWTALSDLVDRRSFSWTLLLSRLEHALPWDVKLVEISPLREGPEPELSLLAVARTSGAGLGLIARLEEQPEFARVRPLSLSEGSDKIQLRYSLRYFPAAAPLAAAGSSPEEVPGDAFVKDAGVGP